MAQVQLLAGGQVGRHAGRDGKHLLNSPLRPTYAIYLQTGKSDDWEREAFDVVKYSKMSFFSSVIGVAAVAALFRWGGASTCVDPGQGLCCGFAGVTCGRCAVLCNIAGGGD